VAAQFLGFDVLARQWGLDEAHRGMAIENHTVAAILGIVRRHGLQDAIDLTDGGRTFLARSKEDQDMLKENLRVARESGVDLEGVSWITEDILKEVCRVPSSTRIDTHFRGQRFGTSFGPAVYWRGYNLWPLKFVTHLYNVAAQFSSTSISLHTRTPVHSISASGNPKRRWTLATPRGSVDCSYVIHATNAYAPHLLPHLRGPDGIVPTRGQVFALRAAAGTQQLSMSGWIVHGGGDEYWFPRPVKSSKLAEDVKPPTNEGQSPFSLQRASEEEHPIVILGGAREAAAGHEVYITDDSTVNAEVGRELRDFLPGVFPAYYEKGREPEMEWVRLIEDLTS
jgi:glycine/D-amino acid oxidase-like deaminating enzyme